MLLASIDNAVTIIDVTDRTAPKQLSVMNDGAEAANISGAFDISVAGRFAYVTAQTDHALTVIDLGGLKANNADVGALAAGSAQVRNQLDVEGTINTGNFAAARGTIGSLGIYQGLHINASTTASSTSTSSPQAVAEVFASSTRPLVELRQSGAGSSLLFSESTNGNGLAPASTTAGLLQFSANPLSSGSASGTYLAANPTSFAGDFIRFQTGGVNRFVVTGAGNVGIGNTTPEELLHVGSTSVTGAIMLENADRQWIINTDPTNDLFNIQDETGGTTALSINYSGNIGISDTNPDAVLEVSASGGTTDVFYVSSNDNSDGDYIKVQDTGHISILSVTAQDGAGFTVATSTIFTASTTLASGVTISGNATTSGWFNVGTTDVVSTLGSTIGAGDLYVGSNATVTASLSITELEINNDYLTDLTGTGLTITSGALTVDGDNVPGINGAWEEYATNILRPTNTAAAILINTASSTITNLNTNNATTTGNLVLGVSSWATPTSTLTVIDGLHVFSGTATSSDAIWIGSAGTANNLDLAGGDLYVQDDLEVDGTIYTADARITGGAITGITDLVVADGGTGASTLTDHGVLVGSGTDAITALSVGTNGQLLIGSTGADPVFATLNCDANLTCTTGAGTLEIDVDDAFLLLAGDSSSGNYQFSGEVQFQNASTTVANNLSVGGNASTTGYFHSWRYPNGSQFR